MCFFQIICSGCAFDKKVVLLQETWPTLIMGQMFFHDFMFFSTTSVISNYGEQLLTIFLLEIIISYYDQKLYTISNDD